MVRLNRAYEVLSNSERRRAYDAVSDQPGRGEPTPQPQPTTSEDSVRTETAGSASRRAREQASSDTETSFEDTPEQVSSKSSDDGGGMGCGILVLVAVGALWILVPVIAESAEDVVGLSYAMTLLTATPVSLVVVARQTTGFWSGVVVLVVAAILWFTVLLTALISPVYLRGNILWVLAGTAIPTIVGFTLLRRNRDAVNR
jgi:hypothetical protein